MSYKDDDKIVFPTRKGEPIGTSAERKMLDNARGAQGIVERVRELPDGSRVRLKTRAGFPDFVREPSGRSTDVLYEYKYAYGLVDTKFSISGSGSDLSLGGPLRNLIDENGLVKSDAKTILKDNITWKAALFNDLPTNYSGLMRRVAQVRHGAHVKKVSTGGAKARASKYSVDDTYFSYATSDGIYVDNDSGRRWVIEVDGTGVYRIPIHFVKELPAVSGGQNWRDAEASIFAGNTYEAAVNLLTPYWTIKRFNRADRALIGSAPPCYSDGYITWYPWLGWAFNYDGSKATIVCLRNDPSDASWAQTTLFDITITAIDGVPSYATCASSETSRIATNRNDYDYEGDGIFQVADTYPGFCSTISMFHASAPALEAVIFSYYAPSGTKKLFKYKNYATTPVSLSADYSGVVNVPITNVGWWSGGAYSSYDGTKTPSLGVVSETETGFSGGGYDFSGDALTPLYGADEKSVSRSDVVRREAGVGGWMTYAGSPPYTGKITSFADGSTAYVDYDGYSGRWWLKADALLDVSGGSRTNTIVTNNAVVMPGYDREAISFATYRNSYTAAYTETSSVAPCSLFNGPVVAESGGGKFDLAIGSLIGNYYDSSGNLTSKAEVAGFVNHAPTAGLAIDGYGTLLLSDYNDLDSNITVTTGSRDVPENITTAGEWIIHVGDEVLSRPLLNGTVFNVYTGGETFSYRIGGSAWSGALAPVGRRMFFSKDVNYPPEVVGVGGCHGLMYMLNNFVGVF